MAVGRSVAGERVADGLAPDFSGWMWCRSVAVRRVSRERATDAFNATVKKGGEKKPLFNYAQFRVPSPTDRSERIKRSGWIRDGGKNFAAIEIGENTINAMKNNI